MTHLQMIPILDLLDDIKTLLESVDSKTSETNMFLRALIKSIKEAKNRE